MSITENYQGLRNEIPEHVKIVLAAKTRSADEIREAIAAGATDFGQNYVQEAEQIYTEMGEDYSKANWHMIGDLQKNKINKALPLFGTFQTIDSIEKAEAINLRATRIDKKLDVLIEINSANEMNKSGMRPEFDLIAEAAKKIEQMDFLNLIGLMTMGPFLDNPEEIRPYFRITKAIFDQIKSTGIVGEQFDTLSMGMSDSWRIAIEEGSTMVRLGTIVFGARQYR